MPNKIVIKLKKFFEFGNRTFDDYFQFLESARSSGFQLVPLKEFIKKKEAGEKSIGLRHDVDASIDWAIKLAVMENKQGIRSTYFVVLYQFEWVT